MILAHFTRTRIGGLAAVASLLLGIPAGRLAPAPQERAVLYAFETLDRGLFSGFGEHCWGGPKPDFARPGSPGLARGKIVLQPPSSGPCYAEVASPAFEAIFRSECAWLDFWQEHAFDEPQIVPLFVDFSRYVVVAVIEGPGSGCSGIEIAGLSRGPGDTRRVHVRQEIPCSLRDCMVLSNPYHFVLVPAEFLPPQAAVAFVHDEPVPEGIVRMARRP